MIPPTFQRPLLNRKNFSLLPRLSARKDLLDKFQIVSNLVLAAAGLIVAVVIPLVVRYHDDRAVERQIQSQADGFESQRRIAGAQLAASLMSTVTKGSEAERETALAILSSFAPEQAEHIASVLIARAETPTEQNLAKQISTNSIQNKREIDFAQYLENARKYLTFGLDAQADREYLRAYESLPDRFKGKIPSKLIEEARSNYDRGNFSTAARQFQETFRDNTAK